MEINSTVNEGRFRFAAEAHHNQQCGFRKSIFQNSARQKEQVCKPNFVSRFQISDVKFEISNLKSGGDHSSSPAVAGRIKQPTRRS